MSWTKRNTTLLKDYSGIREEFVAAAALSPGHLLEITSDGQVQKHSAAAGNVAPVLVALEDSMQGNDVDDAYSANNVVQCAVARPGDRVQLRLKDGQNVAIGAKLESAGDGTVQAHVVDSTGIYYYNTIVGIAMAAVDMSGSSGADPDGFVDVMIV
jgi:hypothetical protein